MRGGRGLSDWAIRRVGTLERTGSDELTEIERGAEDLGNITFVGWLDDITPELAGADVFVSASHREGLSGSLVEACMSGLPVVATRVGAVATEFAPHLMDFHPTYPRWAYVRDDAGWVHKVDLYSMRTVRKVRAGLNGISLAVSRDGRYVAAGSYVPHTMVIMDASTLEPLHMIELAGVDPDGRHVPEIGRAHV